TPRLYPLSLHDALPISMTSASAYSAAMTPYPRTSASATPRSRRGPPALPLLRRSGSRAPGTGAQADRLRGAARSEPPSALTCRPHRRPPKRTPQALLEALYRDPTLRFNEHGRRVLRWFMHGAMPDEEWRSFLPHVPMHQAG